MKFGGKSSGGNRGGICGEKRKVLYEQKGII